jgi:hypothetical protein
MPSAPCGREAKTRCATSKPVIFTAKTSGECCIRWLTAVFAIARLPATMIFAGGRTCRARGQPTPAASRSTWPAPASAAIA